MKVACVQSDVVFGDPAANAAAAVRHLEELKARGVDLAVFPEAFLTGYCVESAADAERIAIRFPSGRTFFTSGSSRSESVEPASPIQADHTATGRTPRQTGRSAEEPHPLFVSLTGPSPEGDVVARSLVDSAVEGTSGAIPTVRGACERLGIHCVLGFAGKSDAGLFNGAALIEPNGEVHLYAKTHLPELGLDKFVVPGSELQVFDTAIGRIGIVICFDLRPPEPIRVLALKGAELIVLPTNWPEGADFAPAYMAAVRANENRVFLAACNRVGTENGFRFIGKSGIWDVAGKCLASAGDGEEILMADLDLAQAREKRVRTIPGRYETTVFESRRPELYGEITHNAEYH
jgi:predicted amidohydrolase